MRNLHPTVTVTARIPPSVTSPFFQNFGISRTSSARSIQKAVRKSSESSFTSRLNTNENVALKRFLGTTIHDDENFIDLENSSLINRTLYLFSMRNCITAGCPMLLDQNPFELHLKVF